MEQTCVEDELTVTDTRLTSESKRQKICKSLEDYKANSAGILKSLQDHIDMLESDIEKRSREVETKDLELGKIQKKIEAAEIESGDKEKELDLLKNQVKLEETQLQVLSLYLGKFEKQIKKQTNALGEKEKEIKAAEIEAGDKLKELDLLRNQIEQQTYELEENARKIKAAEIEAGDKEKVLDSLRNQIKSEEKTLIEVRKSVDELESKKKELRQTSTVFVKHEQQPVAAETEQFIGDPLMRYKITSASLGHHEVSTVLRAKRNPAEYVLDLVEGEVRDAHRRKESGLRELVVENLVLFFDELAEIGGLDKPLLQLKATQLATLWKSLMRIEAPRSSLEALAFLLFIVAYGIKSLINEEETALLVTSVSHYKQGPKLFHSLGLELKISDYVLGLINDRRYIPAVRLVCLYKLKDFSAQTLLMKEVIDLKRSALGKIDNKDVGRLRAIVELAADYKLDIDLSADLIAKLVFQKDNSTPPVLHSSVEAPSPSGNGGSSGSRVGLQVPTREIETVRDPIKQWSSYRDFRLAESSSTQKTLPSCSATPSVSDAPRSEQSTARPPMTVEELVRQPGRDVFPRLHPKRLEPGSTWFSFSKNGISKCILRMLHGMLQLPYPTYNDMPGEDRELWFKTFAQEYNWDHVITPQVRIAFHKYAATKYKEHMNVWKQKWVAGKDCPKGLNGTVWEGLKEYWVLPETARTSKINSKNRKSERGGKGPAVHNAGAKSFVTREDELTKQAGGVRPDFVEVMEDTHTNKKTGLIQDGVIADLVETLKKKKLDRLTQLSQDADGSSSSNVVVALEEINRMVLEETPTNRDRRLGLGSLTQSFGFSSSGPSHDTEIFAELEEKNMENARLKEQNEKMANFMRSKFHDFPDGL